jgi:hypothetical protein
LISGDFDQAKYGRVMSVVDMLIEFIFTPEKGGDHADSDDDNLDGGDDEEKEHVSDRNLKDEESDGTSLLNGGRERKLSGDLEPLPLPIKKSFLKKSSGGKGASTGASSKSSVPPGLIKSIATIVGALEKHLNEHPEYGATQELKHVALFEKFDSCCGVANGLLDCKYIQISMSIICFLIFFSLHLDINSGKDHLQFSQFSRPIGRPFK